VTDDCMYVNECSLLQYADQTEAKQCQLRILRILPHIFHGPTNNDNTNSSVGSSLTSAPREKATSTEYLSGRA
jgi:hypothetical protein